MQLTAIVVGAGIVGLATARALSLKGYNVTVIERTDKAVGASIRNFGMVWPIGQPNGILYNRALRSKMIWKEIADATGIWYDECGSLHVAYHQDEWQVLQELYEKFKLEGRPVALINSTDIMEEFNGVRKNDLIGGLYSSTEMIIDSRVAIAQVPNYLHECLNVNFIWGKLVTKVDSGKVWIGNNVLKADLIFVCSGSDFETLFSDEFSKLNITKCKLQMMRFAPPIENWNIGAALCGGLSLIHYDSFKVAPSLNTLQKRYKEEMSEYLQHGIHVMVSQNDRYELTVGDSHEYASTHDPFDKAAINQLIINYLNKIAITDDWKLIQTWNGIYAKMLNGSTEIFLNITDGVYVINGLGGAGMTLSFGLAEELVAKI